MWHTCIKLSFWVLIPLRFTVELAGNDTASKECNCLPKCKRKVPVASMSQARFSAHRANTFAVDHHIPTWLEHPEIT